MYAFCHAPVSPPEQKEADIQFDLTTLRLFLSTVEQGSIAGAAKANAIAPSAISRRISDLEIHMGTTLMYRKTRGIEPTPAGEALARHAQNLVRLMSRMEAEMIEYAEGVLGHVRLAANTSAITQFLPPLLSAFKTENPDVRIALSERTSDQAVHDVSEGLADIALFSEVVDVLDLETFPWRQDQLVLITPPDHALAGQEKIRFADSLDYPHVGLQSGSSLLYQLQSASADLDREIAFAVQVTSFDGVRRMVESGLGVAVLPEDALPPETGSTLRVIPLEDTWARRQLLVGVREASALSRVARRLLENLVA
jgi:DNA-binding transcriptional LysR family regulator